MPRPETIAKARRAISLIAEGMPVKTALELVDLSNSALLECRSRVREVALAYAQAREIRADLLADELLEIADGPGDPQQIKNRLDTRKWLASKYQPGVYGERIDLNVQQNISILDVRAEAMGRVLRPLRDQESIEDAVVIDKPTLTHTQPSDDVSEGQAPSEPGIFD